MSDEVSNDGSNVNHHVSQDAESSRSVSEERQSLKDEDELVEQDAESDRSVSEEGQSLKDEGELVEQDAESDRSVSEEGQSLKDEGELVEDAESDRSVSKEGQSLKDEDELVENTAEDEDNDEGENGQIEESVNEGPIIYDIDQVMEKRRKERRKRRVDSHVLSELDDIACHTVDRMKRYAKADRTLNEQGMPAVNKLKFVSTVENNALKAGALSVMLQNDLLSAIRDWLTPLPDRSLPNLKIRNTMIDILEKLGTLNVDLLRDSGIGRAVMLLAKHPRETQQNQTRLWRLINDWSRSIFDLDDCDDSFSKEERQKRDIDRQPSSVKKRRLQLEKNPSLSKVFATRQSESSGGGGTGSQRPEMLRARVPRPAACDYVYRPASKVTEESKPVDQSQSQRLERMRRRVKRTNLNGSMRSQVGFNPTGPKGGY